jgi:predicted transcriptional regulator
MKTAVSLPDALFRRLEAIRKRFSLTRSEAVQRAVADWIAQHSAEDLTATIDRAVERLGPEARLDPGAAQAQRDILRREDW